MNPAEEIINVWLNEKGFFTTSNIRVKWGQEIDILAYHPLTGEKWHIEAHVSINPVGALRAHGRGIKEVKGRPLRDRLKEIYDQKFIGRDNTLAEKAAELFGTRDYKRIQVWGRLPSKHDRNTVRSESERLGVNVLFFDDIIKELGLMMKESGKTYPETTRKFVQLCSEFLAK